MSKQKDYSLRFDFGRFEDIVRCYFPRNSEYTVDEVLSVFYTYFALYEEWHFDPHPIIRIPQIINIISKMKYAEYMNGVLIELEPENYRPMIEKHFQTEYKNCDYNINHFFAGKIRAMRYFETCY